MCVALRRSRARRRLASRRARRSRPLIRISAIATCRSLRRLDIAGMAFIVRPLSAAPAKVDDRGSVVGYCDRVQCGYGLASTRRGCCPLRDAHRMPPRNYAISLRWDIMRCVAGDTIPCNFDTHCCMDDTLETSGPIETQCPMPAHIGTLLAYATHARYAGTALACVGDAPGTPYGLDRGACARTSAPGYRFLNCPIPF